jgi:hypothetical protein
MERLKERVLEAYLVSHLGVLTRARAVELGLRHSHVDHLVQDGRWRRLHRGVYWIGPGNPPPISRIYAATLATGPLSAASHSSAAYLWNLTPAPGSLPEVTMPAGSTGRRTQEVRLHHSRDLDPARIVQRRGLIAVTDPLRTVIDLGGVVGSKVIDSVIDRGLAAGTFTVEGLQAELSRLRRPGRAGPRQVARALQRRGMLEAPTPSVLESKVLRLLTRWNIPVAGVEVSVLDGRYRLDVAILPGLALEVDGYAYHWSPEAMAADNRRRNAIQAAGTIVVTTSWHTVVHTPALLRQELDAAICAWQRRRRVAG